MELMLEGASQHKQSGQEGKEGQWTRSGGNKKKAMYLHKEDAGGRFPDKDIKPGLNALKFG